MAINSGAAAKAQYQTIMNKWKDQERPWPETLGEAAYAGLAGEVVRMIEPHTEADSVALLVQFLAAFGSVVGRGPHYQVEGDQHHANLFAVLVGESAKARKGTSWGRIRQLFELLDDPWSSSCVHSGLSSGEGLIWAVRDPSSEDDAGIDDKRLLVQESEFGNVLRVVTREGNTLSRVIRDAWDRGSLKTMTKNSPASATGAHVSIVGHITADELRRYLDRTEAANGFANRFIFICVRRARLLPHGGTLDKRDMMPIARRLAEAVGAARRLEQISMDPGASMIWESVYAALSEGKPGLTGCIVGRAEAQVIRLATIYAMLDGSSLVHVHHLEAAIALWEYAEASAAFVFGQTLGDPIADQIMTALQAAPDGMTRTAISALLGRNRSAMQIGNALELLKRAGSVVMETEDTNGRTAERWKVC